ncbi:MAG: hypothetical protein ACREP7_01115 [Lysobacter sp.]
MGQEKRDRASLRFVARSRRFVPKPWLRRPHRRCDVRADRAALGIPSAGDLAMPSFFAAAFAVCALFACQPIGSQPHTRYFELINRAHDRLTSVSIAVAGSDAYQDKPLGAALDGGGGSTTLQIAAHSCRYDFRFQFANARAVVYTDIDVCRYRSLRIAPLARTG